MAQGKKCAWTLGITWIKAAKCFHKEIFPCPGYYKQCCDEHWGTCVSFSRWMDKKVVVHIHEFWAREWGRSVPAPLFSTPNPWESRQGLITTFRDFPPGSSSSVSNVYYSLHLCKGLFALLNKDGWNEYMNFCSWKVCPLVWEKHMHRGIQGTKLWTISLAF